MTDDKILSDVKKLKTGDIILTSRGSLISIVMNFFQSDPCYYGHSLLVNAENNSAFEAYFKLREVSLEEVFTCKRHKYYKIIRYENLTSEQAAVMVKSMGSLVGKLYSVKRLVLQLFDHIFETNWFTRLSSNKRTQVCSSYVAWGYYVACGIRFNDVRWQSCDPDDFEDHVLANPDSWTVVATRDPRK